MENTATTVSTSELGQISFVSNMSCLDYIYVRGEAYIATGQGAAAAAEFRKILNHGGIVWNRWMGDPGASGIGSRQRLAVENISGSRCRRCPRPGARSYKDFLTLWNDADPEVPILKVAKAEYSQPERRAVSRRPTICEL